MKRINFRVKVGDVLIWNESGCPRTKITKIETKVIDLRGPIGFVTKTRVCLDSGLSLK